ncbi:hypothetical protein DFH09DRAFT_1416286 [Mycena vulgaris]|nr:hypothetical protein DFH09DRAFT_1416286 [Mycena vulgaris]
MSERFNGRTEGANRCTADANGRTDARWRSATHRGEDEDGDGWSVKPPGQKGAENRGRQTNRVLLAKRGGEKKKTPSGQKKKDVARSARLRPDPASTRWPADPASLGAAREGGGTKPTPLRRRCAQLYHRCRCRRSGGGTSSEASRGAHAGDMSMTSAIMMSHVVLPGAAIAFTVQPREKKRRWSRLSVPASLCLAFRISNFMTSPNPTRSASVSAPTTTRNPGLGRGTGTEAFYRVLIRDAPPPPQRTAIAPAPVMRPGPRYDAPASASSEFAMRCASYQNRLRVKSWMGRRGKRTSRKKKNSQGTKGGTVHAPRQSDGGDLAAKREDLGVERRELYEGGVGGTRNSSGSFTVRHVKPNLKGLNLNRATTHKGNGIWRACSARCHFD